MKFNKIFLLFIALILSIGLCVSSAGCSRMEASSGSKGKKSSSDNKNNDGNDKDKGGGDSTGGMIDEMLGDLPFEIEDGLIDHIMESGDITKKGWPEGKIPDSIPEYEAGEVVNSGGNNNDYTILVDNTTRDDLDEYLEQLESEGWYINADPEWPYAQLGNIELRFQFNTETLLQISVYVTKKEPWPEEELPDEIIEPDKGEMIGGVSINELSDNPGEAYNISFEFSGLTQHSAGILSLV
jgi:hypothetical protein